MCITPLSSIRWQIAAVVADEILDSLVQTQQNYYSVLFDTHIHPVLICPQPVNGGCIPSECDPRPPCCSLARHQHRQDQLLPHQARQRVDRGRHQAERERSPGV